MILDRLEQAERYFPLHPGFAAAIDYVRRTDFSGLPTGRHGIDGDRLYLMLNRGPGKGRGGAQLESHRRYIDIQFTLSGTDEIGWKPTPTCASVTVPFDGAKDIGFFGDSPDAWVAVPPRSFLILYPEDAHAPMGGTGALEKAVLKVAVDWR
jgi:YhcH/YjgK/YiaL family protein